jgi:antitoxin HigA-1
MTSNSLTTIDDGEQPDLLQLVHPGEILLEDFLKELAMSQNQLARSIGVPPRRINEIVHGTRAITADTALRLARFFGTSPEFWMNLQSGFELRRARRHSGDRYERDIAPLARTG